MSNRWGVAQSGTEVIKTADHTVLAADTGKTIIANKATAIAFSMSAAATLGSTFMTVMGNIGVGDLAIAPDGAETINGDASLVLAQGESALVTSNGALLRALLLGGTGGAAVLDEDDFASDSPTQPPSQQSTGAYMRAHRAPNVILEEAQTAGTNAGDFTSGSWQDRLNVESYDPRGLCTFTGPGFVLAAGTYFAEWDAVAFYVERNQSRLYNLTAGTVLRSGRGAYAGGLAR